MAVAADPRSASHRVVLVRPVKHFNDLRDPPGVRLRTKDRREGCSTAAWLLAPFPVDDPRLLCLGVALALRGRRAAGERLVGAELLQMNLAHFPVRAGHRPERHLELADRVLVAGQI